MEQTLVDKEYLEAILTGDRVRLKDLYRSFFPMIKKLVLDNSGNEEDAKDLLQDALATIFDKANQPDFELTSKFGSYLYGVSRFLWLNQLKKKYRQDVTITNENTYMDDVRIDLDLETVERRQIFDRHFLQLEEACRKVLSWFFEKKPMKEIAALINTSEDYARRKKYLCQKHLTKSIENDPAYRELSNKN